MILVKCPPLCFNLHTERERATECKKQSFKEKKWFLPIYAVLPQFTGWVKYPRRCISRVMHLTFAMLTCNVVHKLEDFFPGLIKKKSFTKRMNGGWWFEHFIYQQKCLWKWQKGAPLHFKFVLKNVQTLLLIASCIKCVCLVSRATVHKQGANTVWQNGMKNEPSVWIGHFPFPHLGEKQKTTEISFLFSNLPLKVTNNKLKRTLKRSA